MTLDSPMIAMLVPFAELTVLLLVLLLIGQVIKKYRKQGRLSKHTIPSPHSSPAGHLGLVADDVANMLANYEQQTTVSSSAVKPAASNESDSASRNDSWSASDHKLDESSDGLDSYIDAFFGQPKK
jgi:hypothetical protein